MTEQLEPKAVTPQKRRKPRRWLRVVIAVVVVAAIVLGVLWYRQRIAKAAEKSAIRTAEIKRGDLVQSIDSTGTIAAETGADVKIGSQISGVIKRLYADVDTQVTAGQVIAEIAIPDLQANLQSAQRNLDQTRVRYQQQLQGVGMTHTQLASAFEQATESLHRAEAQRAQAVDALRSAQLRLKSAQATLPAAQAKQGQSEANLRSARAGVEAQLSLTSTDVRRAQAALDTAQSGLVQAQKTADLQIANSTAAVKQAQSGATLAEANLKRAQSLAAQGFVSVQDVDTNRSAYEVAVQQVDSAQATLRITQEKVTADLASARDLVEQAKAGLVAAQAEVHQETIRAEAVKSAEQDLESSKAGVVQAEPAMATAQSDLESAQSQVSAADSDIRSSQAAQRTALGNMTQDKLKQQDVSAAYEATRQAQAQVDNQQSQVDKSFVRSPISGTVVSLSQQEGETVAASLASPTLCEVVDLHRLQVDAYVDETDIGQIRLGQPASITVDAFPKRPFTGKISKIASVATLKDNVVTYQVTIDLDAYPLGMLKPQMTADVHIELGRKTNVVLAPNEAVKRKGTGSAVVVLKDGRGEVREVKVGTTDADSTEIVSGLQEGETVVLAGFDKLGIQGFASAAALPGFLKSSSPFGGPGGGAAKGGGAPRGGGK